MKLFVGLTDNHWFEFLGQRQPDEVNFWLPNTTQAFRALHVGEPFLFKLHHPKNFIVGGGFFVTYSILPLSLAWQSFGEKNGALDYVSLRNLINQYRTRRTQPEMDPIIGCIILTTRFFFDEDNWVPVPSDWSSNIVRGKTYDTTHSIGNSLWRNVEERMLQQKSYSTQIALQDIPAAEDRSRYYLTRSRLGQGAFRILVTEVYHRRCAVTAERTLPVLQAAHIKPYQQSGPNETRNGLLLRADLHILFDRGYITLTKNLEVEVSKRIKEEYENGREYYALRGKRLAVVPFREIDRPSPEFIE